MGFPTGGGGGKEGRRASLAVVLRSMGDAREVVLPGLYQQRWGWGWGGMSIFLLQHIVSALRLPLTEHPGLKSLSQGAPRWYFEESHPFPTGTVTAGSS